MGRLFCAPMDSVRVAGAQLNLLVGDLTGNADRILETMAWAERQNADLLILPELAISGYPPEDLVLREGFVDANLAELERLATASGECVTLVGFVDRADDVDEVPDDAVVRSVANAAAVLHRGAVVGVYHKVLLPNYGVFDESRYFVRGGRPATVWDLGGPVFGVSVCEDIWVPDGPPSQQASAGAQILCNLNASPFDFGKAHAREDMLRARARAADAPVVYVNLVGGQDELVFDGASVIIDAEGEVLHRSPQFVEDRFVVDVPLGGRGAPASIAPLADPPAEIYGALTLGLADYVRKNGFSHVVVSLSGGIDSALTAAIAADALGPDSVWGVTMPTRFSSEGSVDDSRELADRLGIRFDRLDIDGIYAAFLEALEPVFEGTTFGTAEENIQARIRGAMIMAVSNKHGGMVVATGNKSEMAVGYATLYGDMAGGFAILKDVFKQQVYELSRWRNARDDVEVIPAAIIDKAPSAELRPDQKDSDSLPPYDVLDGILERYIEEDRSIASIVAEGFDEVTVRRVVGLVDRNEYKRRQSAPGVKISVKAFGKDRRLPITNHYRSR